MANAGKFTGKLGNFS